MRFMVMHKVDEKMEAGARPDTRLIEQMGALIGEAIQRGQFLNGGGLKRSVERVRLRLRAGETELTRGPLRGDNELVAGFAMLEVKNMDAAIDWATRMARAEGGGDVEIEIGPLVERWDLGVVPKPEGELPLHVLLVRKGDAASEAGARPSEQAMANMQALIGEMKAAGVLMAIEGLKPSSRGARLEARGGKHTWTDGPFTESKELIAGFSILSLGSLDEVKAWTTRYANILGDIQVDVREVE